jgi:hypothetical protein
MTLPDRIRADLLERRNMVIHRGAAVTDVEVQAAITAAGRLVDECQPLPAHCQDPTKQPTPEPAPLPEGWDDEPPFWRWRDAPPQPVVCSTKMSSKAVSHRKPQDWHGRGSSAACGRHPWSPVGSAASGPRQASCRSAGRSERDGYYNHPPREAGPWRSVESRRFRATVQTGPGLHLTQPVGTATHGRTDA